MRSFNEIRESLAGSEQSEVHELYENSTGMNLPVVLILKRKALRQFPDGQVVALYYSDQLDKFITVPHSAIGISEEVQIDEAISDREKKRLYAIEVILSNYQKKLIPKHTAIRQLKDKDVVNPEDMLGEEIEILTENPYKALQRNYRNTSKVTDKDVRDRAPAVARGAARALGTLAIGGAVGTGAKAALGAGAAALKYGSRFSGAVKRTADAFRKSRGGRTSPSTSKELPKVRPDRVNRKPTPDASKTKPAGNAPGQVNPPKTSRSPSTRGGKTGAALGGAAAAGGVAAAVNSRPEPKDIVTGLRRGAAAEPNSNSEVGKTSRGGSEEPINRGVEKKTPEERKKERADASRSTFDSYSSRKSVQAGRRSAEWFRDRMKRESSFDNIFKELEDNNISHIVLEDGQSILVDYPVLSSMHETYKELNKSNQQIMLEKMKTIDGFYLIADFSLNR